MGVHEGFEPARKVVMASTAGSKACSHGAAGCDKVIADPSIHPGRNAYPTC